MVRRMQAGSGRSRLVSPSLLARRLHVAIALHRARIALAVCPRLLRSTLRLFQVIAGTTDILIFVRVDLNVVKEVIRLLHTEHVVLHARLVQSAVGPKKILLVVLLGMRLVTSQVLHHWVEAASILSTQSTEVQVKSNENARQSAHALPSARFNQTNRCFCRIKSLKEIRAGGRQRKKQGEAVCMCQEKTRQISASSPLWS